MDLFVWTNSGGSPTGFQLSYDKQDREHALPWTEATGFSHMAVDGGESRPARYKGAPILVANGVMDPAPILEQFRSEARDLPAEFVALVESRIAQLPQAR